MKLQKWFETNLGYHATKEKLIQSKQLVGDQSGDYSGRFTFYLRNFKDYTVQITTKGKIGIFYPEKTSYNVILEQLKPSLVKADGSPAIIINEIKTKEKLSETTSDTLKGILNKSYVSERLIRRHLDAYPEIKSLIEEYERKFGKIEDVREEILDSGSDVVKMGFGNFSEEEVKQSIERERLRRLIAEKVEDIIYP